MNEKKTLSEQEWVYNYLQDKKSPVPLVIGTRGTWGINGKMAIILIAFTIPDIMVFREMHNVVENPIRKVKYKNIVYFAVNIVEKKQVDYLINFWKEN
ncbi:hypothetical protein [Fredinandcohnia quinoae]|uniref:Uncharacterized protein n=1 Tax=Fredinandcohnia quinoae TaxID=2918902 RepID=A0AAW5E173_9BACI|nr:hypothetical protein [Fredinandcohnia sp. SECRCQ15]MCH1625319.1 hypothetical protein [Fredinandcohnia sp. SECRCQ15]